MFGTESGARWTMYSREVTPLVRRQPAGTEVVRSWAASDEQGGGERPVSRARRPGGQRPSSAVLVSPGSPTRRPRSSRSSYRSPAAVASAAASSHRARPAECEPLRHRGAELHQLDVRLGETVAGPAPLVPDLGEFARAVQARTAQAPSPTCSDAALARSKSPRAASTSPRWSWATPRSATPPAPCCTGRRRPPRRLPPPRRVSLCRSGRTVAGPQPRWYRSARRQAPTDRRAVGSSLLLRGRSGPRRVSSPFLRAVSIRTKPMTPPPQASPSAANCASASRSRPALTMSWPVTPSTANKTRDKAAREFSPGPRRSPGSPGQCRRSAGWDARDKRVDAPPRRPPTGRGPAKTGCRHPMPAGGHDLAAPPGGAPDARKARGHRCGRLRSGDVAARAE